MRTLIALRQRRFDVTGLGRTCETVLRDLLRVDLIRFRLLV
jgi:hypothetical protein